MKRQLRLLCDPNPMCYGSSAAMLAILDHLEAVQRVALASPISLEILAGDAAVDRAVPADAKDPASVEESVDIVAFDAALVVANQSNVALSRRHGLPVFYVDILYWFGQRKDQAVREFAEQTFVQRFPGVAERLEAGGTPGSPIEVGPLVRVARGAPGATKTLVQLGGGRSRWVRPGVNSLYAAAAVRWISEAGSLLPRPIRIACGTESAAVANQESGARAGDDLYARCWPQPDLLRELAGAEVYVTAPGLNAVFEGLRANVPMMLLPPQNATQVAQLDCYERVGLVARALNLPALDPQFPASFATLSEEALTAEVLRSLGRLDASPHVARRVAAHMSKQRAEWSSRRQARAASRRQLQ